MNNNNENERYYGLPTLAYLIRWLMELVALLSKPLLMIGAGVSVFVWLTDGSVLSIPLIYYGWALIQAIAVEALFYVIWHSASKAWKEHHPLVFVGNVLLGTALSVCVWAAVDLQSLQQVLRIGNSDALSMLNLNPVMLTHLRSLAAVVLSVVVAMRSVENRNVHVNQVAKGKRKLNIRWPEFLLDWYGKLQLLFHANVEVKSESIAIEKSNEQVEMEKQASEILQQYSAPVFTLGKVKFSDVTFHGNSENVSQSEPESFYGNSEAFYGNSELIALEVPIENEVKDVIPFDWSLTETPPNLLHFPVANQEVESVKPAQVKSEKKHVKPKANLHVLKDAGTIPEALVRAAYDKHPDGNIAALVRITNLSRPTVKKWKDIIDLERQRIETAI